MSDYDPIETAVMEALRILLVRAKQEDWPPAQWTPEVKNALRAVGSAMNYEVRGTGIDGLTQVRYREWLYDMVWCSIQDGCLIDVHLIMECEWKPAKYEIDKDFQKLLVGRAPHRVMIFEKNTREGIQATLSDLCDQVQRFQGTHAGDRYLLCGFGVSTEDFTFKLFVAS